MFRLSKKRKWKLALVIGAVLISIFFLVFTNYLVKELSHEEVENVKKIGEAFNELKDPENEDYTKALQTIQTTTIPIIVATKDDSVMLTKNLPAGVEQDTAQLKNLIQKWRFYNSGIQMNDYQYIYFEEKNAVTLLRYYPYVQLALISIFLLVSYLAFSTSRRYEQNRVWVGMAKETAHQIGTPLSSLMAWVDFLKTTNEPPGEEVISELEKDLQRLEVITERFSKIGSTPELRHYNVYDVLSESIDYLKRRISKKVKISITPESLKEANVAINKNLFGWVIENLTKNAVDAMNGVGEITFSIKENKEQIIIDVKDTGKGVPRSNFRTIFEPGYTTRKRGWGLGLSLTKRIIEEYHKGEIYVKESEPGKGTTFRIKLKKAVA